LESYFAIITNNFTMLNINERVLFLVSFSLKSDMKRERVQSGVEDAKGDGEPSNAFPSEPNSTRTGFISKAL
jgi:hypothetical protein